MHGHESSPSFRHHFRLKQSSHLPWMKGIFQGLFFVRFYAFSHI
ncbi:hypothetical protein SACS_1038 [Parasaccharibacter apium]|uniref:Uncharacterized protein n=1 Tax=Parasaccharibacter apium TaxID=1510841 RepID=A0A7U7G614_9PROT|nr:hypothetical protein SACS_1038 [Parasaccharibacter apium]